MTETLQNADELEQMMELYRRHHPPIVLEIGVWQGGTLQQWLTRGLGSADLMVAVDLEHPNADMYDEWGEVVRIYGRSQEIENVAAMRAHAPYDWIFIDGDHSFEAVRADALNCLTMLAYNGVLLMHDIVAPDTAAHPVYPPGAVFGALRNLYPSDTFISNEPSDVSHGIGVLRNR